MRAFGTSCHEFDQSQHEKNAIKFQIQLQTSQRVIPSFKCPFLELPAN